MVMNKAFNIQANVAAGVAFQTHQVVATFQIKKARNESQNSLPFSPCAIRSSSNNKGTNPINIKGAMPHVGHAAVSKPPLNNAIMIRKLLPLCVARTAAWCLSFFAIFLKFSRKSTKKRWPKTDLICFSLNLFIISTKNTTFAQIFVG